MRPEPVKVTSHNRGSQRPLWGDRHMIKRRYKVILSLLILAALLSLGIPFLTPLGEDPRLENAIQVAAVFVALGAAVVALAASDPKRESVNVRIRHSLAGADITEYAKTELPHGLHDVYRHLPDRFTSARVEFKMSNLSPFTLERPTFTFRLPKEKAHPIARVFASAGPDTRNSQAPSESTHPMVLGTKIYSTGFHSNLFNPDQAPARLEFEDTYVLSNSVLPFWNRGEQVTIWIRMIVDDGRREPFAVKVSVNCDNAGGFTEEVVIDPGRLMASIADRSHRCPT